MKKAYETALMSAGYIAEGNGFLKTTTTYDDGSRIITNNWVTLFHRGDGIELQMYAYENFDGSDSEDKKYDTGIVEMTVDQLAVFVQILSK